MSISQGKYQLAICELYHPYIHGYNYQSDKTIKYQFMVFEMINLESFYNNDFKESVEFIKFIYREMINNNLPYNSNTDSQNRIAHPTFKNYENIIKNSKNYTLDIIEKDILTGREMVAYKKTFWLRILQRKWKNRYYQKIKYYKSPNNLFQRQITGK